MKKQQKNVLEEVFEGLIREGGRALGAYLQAELKHRQQLLLGGVQQAQSVVQDAREDIHERCRKVLGVWQYT